MVEPPEGWPGGNDELPMFEMMSVGLRPRTSAAMIARIGPGAGADVLGCGLELDRAVGVDRATDLLVLGTAAAPLVQGHAQAVANGAAAVLAAGLPLLAPADQLGSLLDLTLVDRCVEVAGRQVLEPELQRDRCPACRPGRPWPLPSAAQPWGWPGARMARAPPQLTKTSIMGSRGGREHYRHKEGGNSSRRGHRRCRGSRRSWRRACRPWSPPA